MENGWCRQFRIKSYPLSQVTESQFDLTRSWVGEVALHKITRKYFPLVIAAYQLPALLLQPGALKPRVQDSWGHPDQQSQLRVSHTISARSVFSTIPTCVRSGKLAAWHGWCSWHCNRKREAVGNTCMFQLIASLDERQPVSIVKHQGEGSFSHFLLCLSFLSTFAKNWRMLLNCPYLSAPLKEASNYPPSETVSGTSGRQARDWILNDLTVFCWQWRRIIRAMYFRKCCKCGIKVKQIANTGNAVIRHLVTF